MDKDQKRLMRRFTILWFISLVFILVMIFFTRRSDTASMQRYIDTQIKNSLPVSTENQLPTPIPGKDGKDGVTTIVTREDVRHEITTLPGEPGRDGTNGKDGLNGKDGADGRDGRELEIQVNPVTGSLETRYAGDSFWQLLIPCEKLLKYCEVDK